MIGSVTRPRVHRQRIRHALTLALGILLPVGCASDQPTIPGASSELIMISGWDADLSFINARTGRIVRHASIGGRPSAGVMSPDGRTLYAHIIVQHSPVMMWDLVAVNVPEGTVRWRIPRVELGMLTEAGVITLHIGTALALSPDGQRLYAGLALRDSVVGIAMMDAATGASTGFIDGPYAGPLAVLPPDQQYPDGVLLAPSRSGPHSTEADAAMHLLHPHTLAVLDSIDRAGIGAYGHIQQLVPAHDGMAFYLQIGERYLRYDMRTRSVTAEVRPAINFGGHLAWIPKRREVVISGGIVRVYDENLTLRDTINLVAPFIGRSPAPGVTGDAVISHDARHLFLWSGSSPGFSTMIPPGVPSRIIVVDLEARRPAGFVDLGGPRGMGRIFTVGRQP